MRRILSFVLKGLVSGLLLYFALNWVNIDMVRDRLSLVQFGWLLFGTIFVAIQIAAGALRWREAVRRGGTELSVTRALRYTLVASFFNQTLPSTIGGDGVRLWLLARGHAGWQLAAYSVIVDRVVGIIALAAVVVACLPWTLSLLTNPVGRTALIIIAVGCMAGGGAFLLLGWSRLLFLQRWAPTRHLAAASITARRLFTEPGSAIYVGVLSILIHLLTVMVAWCAAQSVAAPLTFLQALLLIPPIILIAVIPISIAGWGVREGAMAMAFGYASLPESDGLIVSLLFGVMYFVVGILGGVTWLFGPDPVRLADMMKAEGRAT